MHDLVIRLHINKNRWCDIELFPVIVSTMVYRAVMEELDESIKMVRVDYPAIIGGLTRLSTVELNDSLFQITQELIFNLFKIDRRLWYANMVIEEGWSRSALVEAIKKNWYKSYGKAITNFQTSLPEPNSSLAQAILHDPYHFDFLELGEEHKEKDLEDGLLNHVEKFMRELGQGFAFVGRQMHLQVSDKDFYIDLLFYHLKLRCFVVVELKTTEFKPEYAGKMNFYLSAVDDLMRHPDDALSIGLLICKKKDNFIAEYALRDVKKPIGIAEYETKIVSSLPKKFLGKLPSIQEIELLKRYWFLNSFFINFRLMQFPIFRAKKWFI